MLNKFKSNNINLHQDSLIDSEYSHLVNEFTNTLSPTYDRVNIKLILNQLYSSCAEDNKLFSKTDSKLMINKLTLTHILKFQQKIVNRLNTNQISKSYAKNLLFYIGQFLKYLANNEIVKIFYKPPNFFRNEMMTIEKPESDLLLSRFVLFLENKNYSNFNNYLKNVKHFLEFSGLTVEIKSINFFLEEHIKKYEEFLRIRVVKEELKPSSAYQYLKGIRLFSEFLFSEKLIQNKYIIPAGLINQSKRSNEYVNNQDKLKLLESILANSTNCLRDLSIVMIISETGCRPCEIVNLQVNSLIKFERLIILNSKKSGQRTLQLSKVTFDLINVYLQIRDNYLPSSSEQSLFLKNNGNKITTSTILSMFKKNNLRAFMEIKFTPKSLRHTFISDALNSKNTIEKVAEVVGHKNLTSTMYYFYRDLKSIAQLAFAKDLNLKGMNQ